MTAPLLALAATLGFGWALGWRLLAQATMGKRDRALWSLAWCTPLGFGALSVTLFAWRLVGLPRPGPAALAAAGALVLAAATTLTSRTHPLRPAVEPPAVTRRPGLPAPVSWLAWAALATALVDGARGFVALSRHQPAGSWDAVAVWNVRARMLGLGWTDFPDLLAAVDRSSHPNYPLGLPATVAGLQFAAGSESPAIPALVAAAWAVTPLLLVYLAVRTVAAPAVAALATAWLVSTPLTVTWAAAEVADVPTAALLLGTVLALASRLPGGWGPPLPAAFGGACLGLLPWTKNEGLPMALLVGGCFLLAHRFRERFPHREGYAPPLEPWALMASAAPGLAAALLFKVVWSPGSGLETYLQGSWSDRLLDPRRWWLPARELAARLLAPEAASWWHLVWLVPATAVALALALGAARRPSFAFAGMTLVAIAASWLPIYAATPYPLEWHVASSLDRLLLQVFPTALAVGVTGLAAVAREALPREGGRFG